MTVAVVAEKPSVARDLAAVLGARARGPGCLHGAGYVVTWAIGHLVGIAEPHEMNPRWKRWSLDDLPLLPEAWPLAVLEGTKAQFENVRRAILDPAVTEIVAATDAGREGELIFRYVLRKTGCKKPVKRLWISSLTPDAIRRGFARLEDLRAFDPLARAALARSRADWLVGMNLSRAYSLVHDDQLSVGRVQTPTLAMVVNRELEIRAFVPEDYLEVWATFAAAGGAFEAAYVGPASGGTRKKDAARFAVAAPEAEAIAARVRSGSACLAEVARETKRIPPPLLYDLTELQRHANRLYGISAKRTLEIAQSLYERHKLLSYPRTSSRHLSTDVAVTINDVVRAIAEPYRADLAPGTESRPIPARFVDDARVTDHHAILPTTEPAAARSLSPDERRIYDLVCRRLLQAFHDDHVLALTTTWIDVSSPAAVDRFRAAGESVEALGWKALDIGRGAPAKPKKGDAGERPKLPPGLAANEPLGVGGARCLKKTTKPPPRFSDATLLTAMESAGRTLDDKELASAMRDEGLGTPATRAQTLETLIERGYVERDGKTLQATDKGVHLIAVVDPTVKSPELTGAWEAKLARMEKRQLDFEPFMREIEAFVGDVVGRVKGGAPPPSTTSAPTSRRRSEESPSPAGATATATITNATRAERPRLAIEELLRRVFGFERFRPSQEEVCRLAAAGRDVLLVMPTGAGKSLCYQLPGLARGGTTLVVSPLIALMEDQAQKLQQLGLAAERIHSGQSRAASRAACQSYLDGRLDFLFIAPERLKVPGFAAMLAKRPLALIAIDEAHCISQWGHDFRPDYRLLGEHLRELRGAPIVALTATATPAVQDDIVKQLGLERPARFIQGFRRENIAVEIVEMNPGGRTEATSLLLADPSRRPAIVYAQSRKTTEEMARDLAKPFRVAAYHAGMRADERDASQRDFLRGDVEVIVATIAFGMGIDKPDIRTVVHAGLPQTVEGFYQEIGRAGRDGGPARAVLFHSFTDAATHEYFLERDYPEPAAIQALFEALGARPIEKDALAARIGGDSDAFEKALEKLWLHGGAVGTPDERFIRGSAGWKADYVAQRAHRFGQLREMQRFASGTTCRMRALVTHFGDTRDGETTCATCDVCAPAACVAQGFREPSAAERGVVAAIVHALRERDGQTVGQLHRELEPAGVERRSLEHLIAGLARAGAVRVEDDSFEKGGETIAFRRVYLEAGAIDLTGVALPVRALTKKKGKKVKGRGGGRRAAPKPQVRAFIQKRGGKRARPTTPASGDGGLRDALKAWRLGEAKRRGVPAFRILTDRALLGITVHCPTTDAALASVSGVGQRLAERHGAAVLSIVRRFSER